MEKQVKKTLKNVNLSRKKILVALSGGKDSATVGFLLKKLGYDFEGLYVDLCVGDYSKKSLKAVKKLCESLDVRFHVYDLKKEQGKTMKDVWKATKSLNHCAACGVMKKWVLNQYARDNGFDMIMTGHNLDDEVETFLMNVLKGSLELSSNIGVVTDSKKDKKFVSRVKPLFFVEEKEVLKFAKKNKLPFVEGKCPHANDSYRLQIREFVSEMSVKEKKNVMKNFEKLLPKIKKLRKGDVNFCGICGEPCQGKTCKKCKLFTLE